MADPKRQKQIEAIAVQVAENAGWEAMTHRQFAERRNVLGWTVGVVYDGDLDNTWHQVEGIELTDLELEQAIQLADHLLDNQLIDGGAIR